MSEILRVAYKYRWKRMRATLDECPCTSCKRKFPKGTMMWVYYNKWNNSIADSLCDDCYELKE